MYKATTINILGWDRLGQELLISSLKNAHYAITHKESNECIAFLYGSGIHQIITTFDLYLDPDKTQNLFFYYVKVA